MDAIFGRGPKGPAPPARGAVAGVRADLERAKDGFDPKNPNGVGMAWTHHFLNQKPWHPMNFKNRIRVWEAQQDKDAADKAKEKAQAEFDAEQEYLKTLSYLSAAEQQRYREVQSVSFMYTKPPGLDAALARDAEAEKKKTNNVQQQHLEGPPGAAVAAPGGSSSGGLPPAGGSTNPKPNQAGPPAPAVALPHSLGMDRLREDPLPAMWAAREALKNNPRLAISRAPDVGVFGGLSSDHPNQQLLGEEGLPGTGAGRGGEAELEFLLQLPPDEQLRALKRMAKRRKKEEQERQLREAEAVLRAAGYDLSAVAAGDGGGGGGGGGGKHSTKDKKKRRSKSKSTSRKEEGGDEHKEGDRGSRKAKRKRRRRRDSDSDSSSSPSSSPS